MSPRWHDYLDTHAALRPQALALTDAGEMQWDYAALEVACNAVQALLTGDGLVAGDRVLVLTENCAAAVAVFFACSRAGLCAIPVNARMTQIEVSRIVAHARPALVVCPIATSPAAAAHAQQMQAEPVHGAFGELAIARPYPSEPDTPPDVAVLLYTTGTTGAPKGVMITHDNLLFAGRSAARFRNLKPGGLVYGVAPMSHVIGLASMLTASMSAGAGVWLEARFSAERLYAALGRGITHLPAVPQMHALLMQYVREQGHGTLSSPTLEYVSSGGAPLDPAWKRKAEAFYGLPLQNGYGMTETTAAASITHSEFGDPDVSVGPPLPGVEIRIDETVPGGGDGTGELLVRGPNVMKGYFRSPEETARMSGRRRLVAHWRSGRHRRSGPAAHSGSVEGADHPWRIQRLSAGGRSGVKRSSAGDPVCGGRADSGWGRKGAGLRSGRTR